MAAMSRHRLILLRHAEAEPSAVEDHSRKLTSQGRSQAKAVGREIGVSDWVPDIALISDATRARETYELASGQWANQLGSKQVTLKLLAELYLAPFATVISILMASHLPDGGTVLVVGHNPGLSDAASRLAGDSFRLAPAAAALLEIEAANWTDALQMAPAWIHTPL